MTEGYNFNNLFNNETKKAISPVIYIDIDKLIPNKNNPYSIEEIDDLANSILELGLLQNLVVEETKKDKYTIISGHRRYNALKKLVSSGKTEFNKIPCLVINNDKFTELSTIKLHESNITSRDISPSEKLNAFKELEAAYKSLKEKGYKFKVDYKGKIDFLMDKTNLSKQQVHKYLAINKANDETINKQIETGELNIDEAYDKVKKTTKPKEKDNKAEAYKLCNKLKDVVASLENEEINNLIDEIIDALDYE